jgi:hypothetical protein
MKPGQLYTRVGQYWDCIDHIIIVKVDDGTCHVTCHYNGEVIPGLIDADNKEFFEFNYVLVDDKEERMKILLEIS